MRLGKAIAASTLSCERYRQMLCRLWNAPIAPADSARLNCRTAPPATSNRIGYPAGVTACQVHWDRIPILNLVRLGEPPRLIA